MNSVSCNYYLRNIENAIIWHKNNSCLSDKINDEITRKIIDIAKKIKEVQEKYETSHYSVLVGQSIDFLAFQIIAKTLEQLISKKKFPGFKFLRLQKNNYFKTREDFFNNYPNLLNAEIILQKKEENKETDLDNPKEDAEQISNDTSAEISEQIIAASLSLETFAPLDSCLFVFLINAGMRQFIEKDDSQEPFAYRFIREAFAFYGIGKEEYEPFWDQLVNLSLSKTGLITQILIPKDNIEKFAYVSYAGGFLKKETDQKIHRFFQQYSSKQHHHSQFTENDNDQVRLLAGALNTEKNGIKMKRYSLIEKEILRNYKKNVAKILESILQ